MPESGKEKMFFKNMTARANAPFTIYADLEAITPKVQGCKADPTKSSTLQLEKQIPCGGHAVFIQDDKIKDEHLERGENCIDGLFNKLRAWAHEAYNFKRKYPIYKIKSGDSQTMQNATNCWLCLKPLGKDRVYEHDHITGKLRGIAHKDCNSGCKTTRHTPVIFHNGSGYDFKHLLKHYKKANPDEQLNCVPSSEETYIAFVLRVPVGKYKNKAGEWVIIYEDLRFIDSYRFLGKSLQALVNTLVKDKIMLNSLKAGFHDLSQEQLMLLTRKGVYPYSYMDDFNKFTETELPPRWTDVLSGETVSEEDYAHAQNVWKTLNMSTLGEYHDVYLRTDVYLLADVFENFRRLSQKTHGLDPAHYLTIPNFGWDALLKTTDIEIDLMQDRDQLDFIRSGIRGGMCGPFFSRYSRANNPACIDYDPEKPNTWLILLDANNLYGGVMREPIPFGGLEWVDDVSLEEILSTTDDAEHGYFVVVDLEYPHELHDSHDDYPMAPEHMKPEFEMLSEYQKSFGKRAAPGKKLLQTLYDKTDYVCHYRNLKFYIRHGLKVTALKRVLRFKQKTWMAKYIDINTELRKTATTDCQRDLGKLLNNAVFGKSMEDLLKRVNIKLVTTEKESNQETSKPNFKKFTTFQENLAAVTLGRTRITWTKPTFIGMAFSGKNFKS